MIPINSLIKNMTDIEELRAKIQDVLDACGNHSLSEDTIIHILKDTLGIFVSKKLARAREQGRAEYKREYEMIQKVTDASSAGQLVGRNGGCCNYGGAGCDGGGGAGCDGGGSR